MADTVEGLVKRLRDASDGWSGNAWAVDADTAEEAASALEALVVERDEARDERDQLIAWFDGLTPLEMDDSIRTLVNRADAAEARALAAEAQRDKLRAELLAALKAIRNAARKNRVDPDAIYEIANGAIRDAARSTLNEIAP